MSDLSTVANLFNKLTIKNIESWLGSTPDEVKTTIKRNLNIPDSVSKKKITLKDNKILRQILRLYVPEKLKTLSNVQEYRNVGLAFRAYMYHDGLPTSKPIFWVAQQDLNYDGSKKQGLISSNVKDWNPSEPPKIGLIVLNNPKNVKPLESENTLISNAIVDYLVVKLGYESHEKDIQKKGYMIHKAGESTLNQLNVKDSDNSIEAQDAQRINELITLVTKFRTNVLTAASISNTLGGPVTDSISKANATVKLNNLGSMIDDFEQTVNNPTSLIKPELRNKFETQMETVCTLLDLARNIKDWLQGNLLETQKYQGLPEKILSFQLSENWKELLEISNKLSTIGRLKNKDREGIKQVISVYKKFKDYASMLLAKQPFKNENFSMSSLMARVARVNNFACTGRWFCPECGKEMKSSKHCDYCGANC